MANRSDGQATRERLITAVAGLIAREGPSALTLDRAAEAAQLSKGAVLYHFKSKDALVEALVLRLLSQFELATEILAGKDARSRGSYTRAYARVSFNPRNNTPEATSGLLAAITNNMALLEPAAASHAKYQRLLEDDGISPTVATLVRLAADGLYFVRAFGLAPPSDSQTAAVLKLLIGLVDNASSNAK
jgi:AcrR family transcriptional regulator